jgi:hypothetical protein
MSATCCGPFAELPGDIRSDDTGIMVTLDPPDTPIHRRALHGLVADLNAIGATYPGTDIPVIYRIPRPRLLSGRTRVSGGHISTYVQRSDS